MSRQAAAEREKRANIIKSEGDRDAAKNLAAAAKTMAEVKGAMQLRTLQTLDGLYEILKHDQNNRWMLVLEATIVLLFIIDLVVLIMGL